MAEVVAADRLGSDDDSSLIVWSESDKRWRLFDQSLK